jgi:AbrB family looped-hinge helix DNA binding protein
MSRAVYGNDMKPWGKYYAVRVIDELGRILLPAEIRAALNLKERTPVELWVNEDCSALTLKKQTVPSLVPSEAVGSSVTEVAHGQMKSAARARCAARGRGAGSRPRRKTSPVSW